MLPFRIGVTNTGVAVPAILIADDSAAIQRVVHVSLAPFALDIVRADNFPAAIEQVNERAIDLVIAAADLAATPSPSDLQKLTVANKVPLILLLSSYGQIDKETLQDLGFQQFLQKPFDHRDLRRMVAKNLQLEVNEPQTFPLADKDVPEIEGGEEKCTTVKPPPIPIDFTGEQDEAFSALVKKAVFEYCQNNFPRIAREAVLAEIRRLQDEKKASSY